MTKTINIDAMAAFLNESGFEVAIESHESDLDKYVFGDEISAEIETERGTMGVYAGNYHGMSFMQITKPNGTYKDYTEITNAQARRYVLQTMQYYI